jgi:galactokinase/mevalonate kinase-like predicted kinase
MNRFGAGSFVMGIQMKRLQAVVPSATISRYSWGTLTPRPDAQICLESADLGALFYFHTRSNLVFDGKMDLAKAAIRTLSGQDASGFDLFLKTLEHNLLLCYTGKPRTNDGIIQDQVGRYEHNEEAATAELREQKSLAVEMKHLLLKRRLDDFGSLLDTAWQSKKKMSPRISTLQFDEMYDAARCDGAFGGKTTGAGGGGYLLVYCEYEKKQKVAEAMRRVGAQPTEFGFGFHGLQAWRMDGHANGG